MFSRRDGFTRTGRYLIGPGSASWPLAIGVLSCFSSALVAPLSPRKGRLPTPIWREIRPELNLSALRNVLSENVNAGIRTEGERRAHGVVVVAAAVGAALTAAAISGFWLTRHHGPKAPAPAEAPDLSPRVAEVIQVGPWPGVIAVGGGGVWVAVQKNSGESELVRINETTGRVLDRMPLVVEDLIVAFGSLWASTVAPGGGLHPRVVRIDPATNQIVARFDGMGTYLAAGEGAVWALSTADLRTRLHRIDPATNEAALWGTVLGHPLGLAVGAGSAWLVVQGTHTGTQIVGVDPANRSVIHEIHAAFVGSLVAGDGHLWAPGSKRGEFGTVQWINPRFRAFDFGAGGVWFIGGPHKPRGVCRLNAESLEVDSCVEVSGYADTGLNWPAALDPETDTIWVANYQDTVTRIELR
jgi:hypothetical protein